MNKNTNDEAITREQEHAKTTQFQRAEVLHAPHTPTPWQNGEHGVYVWSKDGNVCVCGHPTATTTVSYTEAGRGQNDGLHEAIDNAHHIVRCVNSHAALLALVERVAEIAIYTETGHSVFEDARALFAQLKTP